MTRTDYGIDAPALVRGFFLAAAALVTLAIVARLTLPWGAAIAAVLALVAVYPLGMGLFMIRFSRVTKVREREAILDLVAWRGDEAVLDVGCGRGLMLVGAARRLAAGRATGIDIWQAADQTANTAAGTLANAAAEGVADRVAVRTADMRALPFVGASFDVVVSHWAVHNVPDAADRATALAEMVRVLRPAGTILLTDIAHRDDYAARLSALGFVTRIVVDPRRDAVLRAISFGSFAPATVVARHAR